MSPTQNQLDQLALINTELDDETISVWDYCGQNSSGWMDKVLSGKAFPYQTKIAEALEYKNVAAPSCHASGKTWDAARIALSFLYRHRPSIVITTAPTDRQVKKLLWGELRQAFIQSKISLPGNLLKQELEIEDRYYAMGFTSKETSYDKFQGFHNDDVLVIVDEASGVTEEIYQGIDGIMSGGNCRLLLIGNPISALGRFYDICKEPGEWFEVISISAFDTPNFTSQGIDVEDIRTGEWKQKDDISRHVKGLVKPGWAAYVYEKYGEGSVFWISRVLGKFPEDIQNGLVPLSAVRDCQALLNYPMSIEYYWRGHSDDEMEIADKVIECIDEHGLKITEVIVDVARSTDGDLTVVGMKKEKGKTKIDKKRIRVKVDVVGVGGGVHDRLKRLGYNVIGISAGETAKDKARFVNVRAEMYWETRQAILERGCKLPEDEELARQLSSIQYDIDRAEKKIKLLPKEELKKVLGRSPDEADMVAMAIYNPDFDDYWSVIERAMG